MGVEVFEKRNVFGEKVSAVKKRKKVSKKIRETPHAFQGFPLLFIRNRFLYNPQQLHSPINFTTMRFLPVYTLFFLFSLNLGAQDAALNRVRIGVRALVPNIAGLHGEYVLPVAKDRLSAAVDFSTISFGNLVTDLLDADGDVKARYQYFSLGANYYLSDNGRAKGPYLGLHYQHMGAKTSVDADGEAAKGNAKLSGMALLFGLTTGGPFLFGFEIGAGMPFGSAKGTVVSQEDGAYVTEVYSEKVPVIPVLNVTLGWAF